MADTARIRPRPTNAAEFLAWEAGQPHKHEFRNGQVRMMTGARQVHNRIALNIASALKHKLRGTPCSAYANDLLVETDVNATYYPDVVVDCGPYVGDSLVASAPTIVFEVLSPSTRVGDFSEKVPDYRDTAAIQQIVLVDSDQPIVHVWARTKRGWRESEIHADIGRLEMPSLKLELTFAEIYEDVAFGG